MSSETTGSAVASSGRTGTPPFATGCASRRATLPALTDLQLRGLVPIPVPDYLRPTVSEPLAHWIAYVNQHQTAAVGRQGRAIIDATLEARDGLARLRTGST